MKKNSLQNKFNDLRKSLIAILSSNKLKAAILVPMALSLVACGNLSDDSNSPENPDITGPENPNPSVPENPNPSVPEDPNPSVPEDPTKDVLYRNLNTLSATYDATSAKSLDDILNNTTFTINYDIIYNDNTVDNKTVTVNKSKLEEIFKDVVSFFVNGDFSEGNQTVDLIITYNGNQFTISDIKNGNYKSQEIQQPQPSIKDVTALLKEILTEAEYNRISEELSSKNITLTAQTIKAVGDNFSDLENSAKNGSVQDSTKIAVKSNQDVFVAQDKKLIDITKVGDEHYSLNSYNTNVVFDGEFNLSKISLPDNNGKGDFSNATLTNDGEGIIINKLNTIRGSSLPTLKFDNVTANNDYSLSDSNDLYKLYKNYSKVLERLEHVKGNMDGFFINGAINEKDNFINGYTLFESDGNTVKNKDNQTVKSLTIDALILMYKNLGINRFLNMIISGKPTNPAEVDWSLTNMVFEEDMSKVTNKGNGILNGIVYFENKPYNNDGQEVKGMLKLDSLEGVSKDTIKICPSTESSVLDVRGVDKNIIEGYDSSILYNNGYTHAIYFSKDFIGLKGDQEKINKLCDKFSSDNWPDRRFINAYLGNDIVHGQSYDAKNFMSVIGAKTPRKLSEFEYFGNHKKFEKSARSTYNEDDDLSLFDRTNLDNDHNNNYNLIAQNNKRIEFIDPETQKIIFSLVNDRQYNS